MSQGLGVSRFSATSSARLGRFPFECDVACPAVSVR